MEEKTPHQSDMATDFKQMIMNCLKQWEGAPPTRESYLAAASEWTAWRQERCHGGLWAAPPRMVTATIDDGWGHGLEVIEKLAAAVGICIHPLGLLQPVERIIAVCQELKPDFLGLTVLQFDSDDAVSEIVRSIPPSTLLVAGGAAFQYDPDFALHTGTPVVVKNGASFVRFLLERAP